MKKILIIITLIFLVGFVTPWDFDNVKEYNEDTQTITITNAYGFGDVIEKLTLVSNTYECGTSCSAKKSITLHTETELIDEIRFLDGEQGTWEETNIIDYQLYIKTGTEQIQVDDYGIICEDVWDTENQTYYSVCEKGIVGNHYETQDIWEEYILGTELPIGTYLVKLEGTKSRTQTIDWQIKSQGIWIDEWALWGGSSEIISYYKLDGSAGVVTDATGNYDGTNVGATRGIIGIINDAFNFSGDNQFVNVSNHPAVDFPLTLQAWFKRTSIPPDDYYSLVSKGSIFDTDTNFDMGIRQGNFNVTYLYWRDSGTLYGGELHSTTNFSDNAWHHLVGIINITGDMEMYLDGVSLGTNTANENFSANTHPMKIGSLSGTVSSELNWNGSIDEVGIWNRSLTEEEVLNLYNSGSGLPFGFGDGNVSVILISPDDESSLSEDITFLANLTPLANLNVNLTNSTLFIWYDNGTLFTTETEVLTGNETNQSNITITNLTIGNFVWNEFGCVINTTVTFCNFANSNFSFNWRPFEIISESFNNETTEGNIEEFSISISIDPSFQLSLGNLIYNGTPNIGTLSNLGGGIFNISRSIVIPNVNADANASWFWQIILEDSSQFNTTARNQTILNLSIDNCDSNTIIIFNYTLVDEELQTIINETEQNTTIEVNLNLLSSDRSTSLITFSALFNQTNPIAVCINSLPSGSIYSVDTTTRYEGADYAGEFHNIQNFTLTNSTTNQNITLFDLLSEDSTNFLITFKDSTFLPIENALLNIQRFYTSEGIFKSVESPKTDDKGQSVGHFDTKTVLYNIIVTKNGQVLATFDNVASQCDNVLTGDCKINLNAFTTGTPIEDFETSFGITYAMSFNKISKIITVQFNSVDGTTKNVTLIANKFDRFGNTSVCSGSLISSSGTVTCEIPSSFGNASVVAILLVDGNQITTRTYQIIDDQDDRFGGQGPILLFILLISIGFMLISHPIGIIIGVIIGLIAGSLLMLIDSGSFLGPTSAVMWLIVTGGILLWKITRRTP